MAVTEFLRRLKRLKNELIILVINQKSAQRVQTSTKQLVGYSILNFC